MSTTATIIRRRERAPLVAVGWAAAVTAVAIVGGLATDTSSDWYRRLERPSWQPPGAIFGAVWTVLYALIAVAATLAYRDVGGPRRRIVLGLFAANLALNLAWTWIFFQGHRPTAAGVEILLLLGTILALIALVRPHNRAAALALAPYAAWVAFATALNWVIAARN
ncbi:MAG: tryptophan-rich sensory protein [Solirubrobacterales bacterium]|nr:tryptophan-rich sensory protein [Solirubrobacterales bacterium]